MSGYTECACRDCFEIAISENETKPELCSECEDAGCDGVHGCQTPYWGDDDPCDDYPDGYLGPRTDAGGL